MKERRLQLKAHKNATRVDLVCTTRDCVRFTKLDGDRGEDLQMGCLCAFLRIQDGRCANYVSKSKIEEGDHWKTIKILK